MTQQQSNLAGVDFSQYPTWEKVTTPRGGVYYVVPGTSWVYDPFASQSQGRPVLFLNPKPDIDEQKRKDDLLDAELRSKSPMGQLTPVVGSVGGTVGGAYAYDKFFNKPTPSAPVQSPTPPVTTAPPAAPVSAPTTPSEGFVQAAQGGAPAVSTPVTPSNVVPPGGTIPDGYTAVGSDASGGTIVAPTDQVGNIPPEALNDPGFLSNINWGKVGQGALAGYQIYTGYKRWKGGDKFGGGLTMAAGGANLAASGAIGAGAQGAAGSVAGGYLVPGLNVAAGIYGGFKTAEAVGDMAAGGQRNRTGALGMAGAGAAIGSVFGPVGTVVGGVVGAIAGLTGSWTGSSKGKAQVMRDGIRSELQKGGILDENFQGTLADGSKVDFGKDGSHLKYKNLEKLSEKQPNAYAAAVPLGDALAAGYGFVGQKASDVSVMYVLPALSNAGDDGTISAANMRAFAQQQGMTFESIKANLDKAKADGRIDDAQYNYYINGARNLTNYGPPQPGQPQTPTAAPLPPGAKNPRRSRTLSPGIDLQGRRVTYDVTKDRNGPPLPSSRNERMGKELANRMNRSNRNNRRSA